MPSVEEIRENGRREAAGELVRWSFDHNPNANLALLARLVIAIESLEEAIRAQPPRP